MTENQDAYPDLLAEEFAPVAPRRTQPAAPAVKPAAEKTVEPKSKSATKPGGGRGAEPRRPGSAKRRAPAGKKTADSSRPGEPEKETTPGKVSSKSPEKTTSLAELLAPPHQQKLSIMMDEELQGQIEAAVTNLHNSGDFDRYATFADVYRKAFAYFFSGKLKATEIYRKGPKRRTTLLLNETLAQKLQGVNSRVRSRMLEQVLRTFYRRHFND